MSGIPLTECCTIPVCACVQLVQSAQTGGQLVSSVSSGQGSKQTDANAIPPSSCRAISARSVIETLRRIVGHELYHMRLRERPPRFPAAASYVSWIRDAYGQTPAGMTNDSVTVTVEPETDDVAPLPTPYSANAVQTLQSLVVEAVRMPSRICW
jgi:hypothetical protein